MARRSNKSSKFRDRVRANTKSQKESKSAYGYLNLPQGIHIYSPKPGSRARLDILPYIVSEPNHPDRNDEMGIATVGDVWYKRPFRTHRNIGADNQTVVCLASIGKHCPICEYRAQRMKDGGDKEETDALKYSFRNLYAVVPIGDREYDEVPHIWDMSQYLFQDLLNDEIEEDERYADFPDPDNGYTLKIRFDEGRIGTSRPFAEASRIDFIDRDQPYTAKELKKVANLDELLNIFSYAKLERTFLGVDDENDDDDRTTRHSRRDQEEEEDTRSTRRSHRDDDDDDDDDDRSTRRSRRSRGDDDDDDDDRPRRNRSRSRDEDEDDDDKKPQQRTRASSEEEEDDDRPRRTTRGNDHDEQDEDDDRPTRRRGGGKSNDKCPSGYRFGIDTDDYDECDDCPVWEACIDAKEAHESA